MGGSGSGGFGLNDKKYSIDDGNNMKNAERSRFIGLGQQTLDQANNKQFAGSMSNLSSNRSRTLQSKSILNSNQKVGGLTD